MNGTESEVCLSLPSQGGGVEMGGGGAVRETLEISGGNFDYLVICHTSQPVGRRQEIF